MVPKDWQNFEDTLKDFILIAVTYNLILDILDIAILDICLVICTKWQGHLDISVLGIRATLLYFFYNNLRSLLLHFYR